MKKEVLSCTFRVSRCSLLHNLSNLNEYEGLSILRDNTRCINWLAGRILVARSAAVKWLDPEFREDLELRNIYSMESRGEFLSTSFLT